MRNPVGRAQGLPIRSGIAEAAVKLFNTRVKATEPFWSLAGVESILPLRALWRSQDDRWNDTGTPARSACGPPEESCTPCRSAHLPIDDAPPPL
jgi:hypothetical protein